jgi:hypothetical protein
MDHRHHLRHQEAHHESMRAVVPMMMVVVAIKQNESIGDGISYSIAIKIIRERQC